MGKVAGHFSGMGNKKENAIAIVADNDTYTESKM
jgi:hypothetical protein